MSELVFEIRGKAIFTQAEDWRTLKFNILEAISVFYDTLEEQPKLVRLNYV
jgi:hypothetical protein